jgi:cobalt-zinc-cadmium efflux system protein
VRKSDVKDNMNVRRAYLHVLSDALGSVSAIIAGAFMLAFEWYVVDPIISVIVAILILRGAWVSSAIPFIFLWRERRVPSTSTK